MELCKLETQKNERSGHVYADRVGLYAQQQAVRFL